MSHYGLRFNLALDLMNGGKTRDWFYLQLQNLSFFDEDVDMDAINACIKGVKVSNYVIIYDSSFMTHNV